MCLFRRDNESTENFEYPNIECVRFTADGVLGFVYNHRIPKDKLFLEAKRLFGKTISVTESTFYLGSQFGLVIVFERQNLSNKKEGQVSIEIKKKPTESNVTF